MSARKFHVALIGLTVLAACAQPVDLELPDPEPTTSVSAPSTESPTPIPVPKTLVVCLGQEPSSLYRYSRDYIHGPTSRAAETVLQALYDGPFNVRTYEYEPVILDKLPSLADSDARLEPTTVAEGDLYLDPVTLQPSTLEAGDPYLPSGCFSPECMRTFSGGEVILDRMVVDFNIRSDVNWSNGEPVTASDSVFSFELDRSVATPTLKTQADRTASYEAIGDKGVRWSGIPGYIDSEYFSNFWPPMPEHQLGSLTPAELLLASETNLTPLGWGPYVIEEWRPGNDLRLTRNPGYFRASEGLPGFDTLLFRFLGTNPPGSIEQLLTSECDILDEGAIADALDLDLLDSEALVELRRLANSGNIRLASTASAEMERLDFGLAPVSGPNLIADPLLRTALTACIDREGLAREVMLGLTDVPQTYLPPAHPLYLEGAGIVFDRQAANELLDTLGWIDHDQDPDTVRVAQGVSGVAENTELTIQFLTTPDGLHQSAAAWIERDLNQCGIGFQSDFRLQAELFESWPDGPAFGRKFESIGWAWPAWVSPLCEMFHSGELPTPANPLGINASGFSDQEYDTACAILLHALPESSEYEQAALDTQQILADALPTLPLYMRPRLLAHRSEICGVQVDATEYSGLWNLEEIGPCNVAP